MPPRVLRPASDSPRLIASLVGTVVCLFGGYQLGARVFKPGHVHSEPTEVVEGPAPTQSTQTATADAGAATTQHAAPPTPVVDAGAPAVVVPVRVSEGTIMGCGDGEELNVPVPRCDNPAGLEPALRARLTAILGACPSALAAARDPSKMLSIGLRVDFPRRRAAVLLGRSSSVPEKINYVACVRETIGPLEEVWRIQGAHPRYLYFFPAHFGPLGANAQNVAPEATPTTPTAPTTPTTPTATADEGDAGAAAPPADLPTSAALLRMPAMGRARVTWQTAIVREFPRNGPVVARLVRDAEMELIDRRGSWWAVRWDRNQVGWTYGDAIGQ